MSCCIKKTHKNYRTKSRFLRQLFVRVQKYTRTKNRLKYECVCWIVLYASLLKQSRLPAGCSRGARRHCTGNPTRKHNCLAKPWLVAGGQTRLLPYTFFVNTWHTTKCWLHYIHRSLEIARLSQTRATAVCAVPLSLSVTLLVSVCVASPPRAKRTPLLGWSTGTCTRVAITNLIKLVGSRL